MKDISSLPVSQPPVQLNMDPWLNNWYMCRIILGVILSYLC